MAKRGRPRKEIDFEKAEKLAGIFCTGEEIAFVLGVDYDTLVKRIREHYNLSFKQFQEKFSAIGKASLRRKQFEIAMSGNVSMLIWLGKQYLDQKDVQTFDINELKPIEDFENMSNEELENYIKKLMQNYADNNKQSEKQNTAG